MAALGNISSTTANATSWTWSHIMGAGANLLVVSLQLDGNSQASNVRWKAAGGDQALTLLSRQPNIGVCVVEIWYLVDPDIETADIEVVVSIKAQHGSAAADYSAAGTPDNVAQTAPDQVLGTSVTVTGVGADDFVQDSGRHPAGAPTVGADQTIIHSTGAGGERVYASTQDGVDGGVMSWTWPAAQDAALIACRIPDAGGGPSLPIALAEHHYRNQRATGVF